MRILTATLSGQGGRTRNEDYLDYRVLPSGAACWAVADGLGGHPGGGFASQIAVRGLIDSFTTQPTPV